MWRLMECPARRGFLPRNMCGRWIGDAAAWRGKFRGARPFSPQRRARSSGGSERDPDLPARIDRWEGVLDMDFDVCIARVTGKDARGPFVLTRQVAGESRASAIRVPYFDRFAGLPRRKILWSAAGPSPSSRPMPRGKAGEIDALRTWGISFPAWLLRRGNLPARRGSAAPARRKCDAWILQ